MADALREYFSRHGPDAAFRRRRPRRAEPRARLGRACGSLRQSGPALPLLRLRQRDLRGRATTPRRSTPGCEPAAAPPSPRNSASSKAGLTRTAKPSQGGLDVQEGHRRVPLLSRDQHRSPTSRRAQDRVCVLNILGSESTQVTPISHAFSRRQRGVRHLARAPRPGACTPPRATSRSTTTSAKASTTATTSIPAWCICRPRACATESPSWCASTPDLRKIVIITEKDRGS